MIRTPARFLACAAAALVPLPVAATPPGGFTLPEPTPTPTPAPAGPADEHAGVAIPPRSAPAPRIEPAPVLTPQSAPPPRPLALPPPRATARPGPTALASPTPAQPPAASAITPNAAPPAISADDSVADPPALPVPQTDEAPPSITAPDDTTPFLPAWWPWAAGVVAGLAMLAVGLMLWRRRKPKVPRLAAPLPGMENDVSATDLALELTLDVTGATRSVMTFTLHYRLTIANRTGRAVNDLSLAVQLECARRGAGNAASPGAAQRLDRVDRIGPHQSRSIIGEVRLPLSEIAPLHQGNLPLFIPLVHVTLEGEGQSALPRSFVVGTPSAGGTGRLHPIRLESPPGSITGLRAQRVALPAASSAAA